jgi:hypothetical protein
MISIEARHRIFLVFKLNRIGLFAAALTFISLSSSIGSYGFTDDYRMLILSIQKEYDWGLELSQGRPFSAVIHWITYYFVSDISGLLWLHILGCLGLSAITFAFFNYLSSKGSDGIQRLTIAIISTIVPAGMIINSTWTVLSSMPMMILLLLLIASKDHLIVGKNRESALLLIGLIASSLYYQVLISFFLLFPIIKNLYISNSFSLDFLNRFKNQFILFVFASLGSLVAFALFSTFYPSQSRQNFVGPIEEKFRFLVGDAIPASINFLSPSTTYGIWAIFYLLIVVTYLTLIRINLIGILILIFGYGLSMAPLVLTDENWPSTRVLMASQWYLAALGAISLVHIIGVLRGKQLRNIVLGLIILGAILSTNNRLYASFTHPQSQEISNARAQIKSLDQSRLIYVKKSQWYDSIAPGIYLDEWGLPSSSQAFSYMSMAELLMRETQSQSYRLIPTENGVNSNIIDFSQAVSSSKSTPKDFFVFEVSQRWLRNLRELVN